MEVPGNRDHIWPQISAWPACSQWEFSCQTVWFLKIFENLIKYVCSLQNRIYRYGAILKHPNIFLLIRTMVFKHCYRQFGCETILTTQNFPSMNLSQMSCVITCSWSFLTSEVWRLIEAKKIIYWSTLWHFNSMFGSSLWLLQFC